MRCVAVVAVLVGCAKPPPPAKPECPPPPIVEAPKPVEPPKPPAFDDAAVNAASAKFWAAIDRYDPEAFDALASSGYVSVVAGRSYDRDNVRRQITNRRDARLPPQSRTRKSQRVHRSDAPVIYVDHCEITLPAHDDVPTLSHEKASTLVWVPVGGEWKVTYFTAETAGVERERELWDEIYRTGVNFKTTANQHLIDSIKGRKPGTALDVAMGQGRNVLYLARQGWKVSGIDISVEGMKIAQAAAAKEKLKIETINHDMTTYDYGKNKWDVITLIYAGSNHALIEKIKTGIKKGGLFVAEFFHKDATKTTGIGGFETGELAKLFADGWTIIKDEVVEDIADWGLAKTRVVRFTAQKK